MVNILRFLEKKLLHFYYVIIVLFILKNIVLSEYLKKRLCYPILKLGYYIEHTMAHYIKISNNIDYIDYEITNYLITYKIYFVNKRMLEIYNINNKIRI